MCFFFRQIAGRFRTHKAEVGLGCEEEILIAVMSPGMPRILDLQTTASAPPEVTQRGCPPDERPVRTISENG